MIGPRNHRRTGYLPAFYDPMSRHRYIVCYDVRDPKRLRKTYRTLMGYGDPFQYSVFVCDLAPAERVLMEEALRRVVKTREDSVIIVNLGPADKQADRRIRTLGRRRKVGRRHGLIV
ncbi:MAG: CRISPR-associated endonuclease Cas2 [Acidobacteria bacterium]|nr:CRISPR-associated endonuclease Cas2 [Acidobacteriota bacterium]MDW7983586.1 CRISPR-associated endonuclease Cas2 [Acidobacteriota bacterium]